MLKPTHTKCTDRYRTGSIGMAVSESGNIRGPWAQSDHLFAENGGHGMLFETFEGELMLSFHQPNSGQLERAKIYRIKEVGNKLIIIKKSLPKLTPYEKN